MSHGEHILIVRMKQLKRRSCRQHVLVKSLKRRCRACRDHSLMVRSRCQHPHPHSTHTPPLPQPLRWHGLKGFCGLLIKLLLLGVLSKMLKMLTMLKEEEMSGYMGQEGGAFARAEGC
jgi:hypothetical protein